MSLPVPRSCLLSSGRVAVSPSPVWGPPQLSCPKPASAPACRLCEGCASSSGQPVVGTAFSGHPLSLREAASLGLLWGLRENTQKAWIVLSDKERQSREGRGWGAVGGPRGVHRECNLLVEGVPEMLGTPGPPWPRDRTGLGQGSGMASPATCWPLAALRLVPLLPPQPGENA